MTRCVRYLVGLLALAAGTMIFVVSHEIIPETHRKGHQLPATLGVMGGFALMMVLDNAFAQGEGNGSQEATLPH